MSTVSLPTTASTRKQIRKKTLSERIEVGITAVLFVMLVIICLLSLLFLSHSNRVATKGYQIKVLRDERASLLTQNEVLGMKIADLQSLEALENDPKIASMVDAGKPMFIRGDTLTAKK